MAYTNNRLYAVLSFLFLGTLFAIAIYALSKTNTHSLPIPRVLGVFTMLLPLVTGASLGTARFGSTDGALRLPSTSNNTQPQAPSLRTLGIFFILTVYETVIVTLAGTHLAPAQDLSCGLEKRWSGLFRSKNADGIKAIQEAFRCCGFNSARDRAWPFPDKTHPVNACVEAFGWKRSCAGPWREEEQHIAGIMMIVGIGVFIWKLAFVFAPVQRPAWLDQLSSRRRDGDTEQRRIRYLPGSDRYRDNPVQEIEDDEAGERPRVAIEGVGPRVDGVRSVAPGLPEGAIEQNAWQSQQSRN